MLNPSSAILLSKQILSMINSRISLNNSLTVPLKTQFDFRTYGTNKESALIDRNSIKPNMGYILGNYNDPPIVS